MFYSFLGDNWGITYILGKLVITKNVAGIKDLCYQKGYEISASLKEVASTLLGQKYLLLDIQDKKWF